MLAVIFSPFSGIANPSDSGGLFLLCLFTYLPDPLVSVFTRDSVALCCVVRFEAGDIYARTPGCVGWVTPTIYDGNVPSENVHHYRNEHYFCGFYQCVNSGE